MYKIKELEWYRDDNGDLYAKGEGIEEYSIRPTNRPKDGFDLKVNWHVDGSAQGSVYVSNIEDGKEFCQAHYEERVLTHLEPAEPQVEIYKIV